MYKGGFTTKEEAEKYAKDYLKRNTKHKKPFGAYTDSWLCPYFRDWCWVKCKYFVKPEVIVDQADRHKKLWAVQGFYCSKG